ncbi:putative alpha-1,6-mannosyltransferase mnn11 [Coniosporium apollinis]|uniref:Alpha-1,6-mannosyltransferase mnn11 n=1 Tax=Coniosporium apollinis TaxID=61459 RepID=A0ABQ9NT22_9PEZI|nr:putative alpha-1,6-mannosyltransferase mnn11 [Coniosporium apollinis]
MHFAFPPRKTSHPPPYALRQTRSPLLRRSRLQFLALVALGCIAGLYILSKLFGSSSTTEAIPAGTPPVVIVTALNKSMGDAFNEKIKQNREAYAARHGYATFFPSTSDYPLGDSPASWSKVPSMRHAMALHPHSTHFMYLSPLALIMNPSLPLDAHILSPSRLESLMIVDQPVVPPDSVIKTFSHLKGDRIDMVLTQDKEGLGSEIFILRRGEWAKYLLDAWFDPLYRSYNFQRAEGHALEHIVQWHGTILAKLALVPQRIMNSYVKDEKGNNAGGVYQDGDFVAHFYGCDKAPRHCEEEMAPSFAKVAS